MKFKMNATPAMLSIHLQAREQSSTPANMNNYTLRSDAVFLWENAVLAAQDGGGLWQLSPAWQWRASGTSIVFNALIQCR